MPLHVPKSREVEIGGPKDPLLRRAGRLAAAAKAVGDVDVKAIAATYQEESGASGLEAASVAATALNAALRSALGGQDSTESAQRAVQEAAKRKTREARSAAFLADRAAEDNPAAQARKEEAVRALTERAAHAVESKVERLEEAAAARRAEREERLSAAASRRCLSEARARFGGNGKRHHLTSSSDLQTGYDQHVPSVVSDDPTIRKARALCSGAASIVAQLEEQNNMLRNKAFGLAHKNAASGSPAPLAPPAPPAPAQPAVQPAAPGVHGARFAAAHAAISNAEEQQLLAKAKELLADYRPNQRKGATPGSSAPHSPVAASNRGGRVVVETIGRAAPRGR